MNQEIVSAEIVSMPYLGLSSFLPKSIINVTINGMTVSMPYLGLSSFLRVRAKEALLL